MIQHLINHNKQHDLKVFFFFTHLVGHSIRLLFLTACQTWMTSMLFHSNWYSNRIWLVHSGCLCCLNSAQLNWVYIPSLSNPCGFIFSLFEENYFSNLCGFLPLQLHGNFATTIVLATSFLTMPMRAHIITSWLVVCDSKWVTRLSVDAFSSYDYTWIIILVQSLLKNEWYDLHVVASGNIHSVQCNSFVVNVWLTVPWTLFYRVNQVNIIFNKLYSILLI